MTDEKLVNELRHCGEVLIRLAEAMAGEENTPAEGNNAPTFEEIRCAMALKIQEGHSEEIKGLLSKYGGVKLSDINAADYVAFMQDVEAI